MKSESPTLIQELIHTLCHHKGALCGLLILTFFLLCVLLAPWISPYDPTQIHNQMQNIPPLWMQNSLPADAHRFLLGTDDVGRDTLSRLIYGARTSMGIGLLVVVLSALVGITFGLTAGYFGGVWDNLVEGLVNFLLCLPSLLLAIVVVSLLGPGLFNAILAVTLISLPGFIRLTKALVIQEKHKNYVLLAQTYGAGPMRIIFWHILPNTLGPLIVQATLTFSSGILEVAALGFLGLGAQPPSPEWGTMLADARAYLESAPWAVTLPGLCILLVVLSFNLIGDVLRDFFDPKLKQN